MSLLSHLPGRAVSEPWQARMGYLLDLALKAAQQAKPRALDARAESRRQRVLALLAERPERKRAMVTDPDDPAHPGDVVLTIALRTDDGPVTAELLLPRDRYDPFLLLDLFDRYSRQQ